MAEDLILRNEESSKALQTLGDFLSQDEKRIERLEFLLSADLSKVLQDLSVCNISDLNITKEKPKDPADDEPKRMQSASGSGCSSSLISENESVFDPLKNRAPKNKTEAIAYLKCINASIPPSNALQKAKDEFKMRKQLGKPLDSTCEHM